MKKHIIAFALILFGASAFSQQVPEVLYYKFDNTGSSTLLNEASSPPSGTNSATLNAAVSQGTAGLCNGALIGSGTTSSGTSTGTGFSPGTSDWTIAFWTSDVPPSSTLFYIFGDLSASSFRCFTNGVAGANNWMLRGPVTDVLVTGAATMNPNMIHFVYDSSVPEIRAYVDGVLNNTVAQSALNINGGDLTVGGYSSNAGLSGKMDEFRWYDYALDATEIANTFDQCLPLSSSPNDAGVVNILSPTNYCSGDTQDLIVRVKNYGTLPLDSCQVNWVVNGVSSSAWYTVNLDTNGGSGPTDTILNLQSLGLIGNTDITVYTSLPNNVTDTVNFNDTAFYVGDPSLNGTYTLGSSGSADFADFTEFTDALAQVGVCGPVVVDVEDGTYAEQITLPAIVGMNSTNTVTIRSASGNASLVKIESPSAPALTMNGGDYFTFENISLKPTVIGNTIRFNGASDFNTFRGCLLNSGDTTSTSTASTYAILYSSGSLSKHNTFENNTFNYGSFNVYWYGTSTNYDRGNTFKGNTFKNAYYQGTYFYYQYELNIEENTYFSNSTYSSGYGLAGYYLLNSKIHKNHVYNDNSSNNWPLYGMYLGYLGGTNLNTPGQVVNNVVSIGTPTSSSSHYGIYLYSSPNSLFAHNTLTIQGGGTLSRAAYTNNNDFGTFANNILTNYAGGYALYTLTQSAQYHDNNVYYTTGTNFVYGNGVNNSLVEWQLTGADTMSVSVNPMFIDTLFGTICNDSINNLGTALSFITNDHVGIMRDPVSPDPGAYEFFSASSINLANETICGNELILNIGDSALFNTILWNITSAAGNSTSTSNEVVLTNSTGSSVFNVSVSASSNCGTSASTATYTIVAPANLDDTTHICFGETAILDASAGPGASISWFPTNETTNQIAVSSPGIYTVTKSENGCESSSTTAVLQSEAVSIADQEPCADIMPIVLSAGINGSTNYSWSGGSTTSSMTNEFNASGDYSVTVTDIYGCESTDSFSIEVIDVPNVVITQTHSGTVYFFNSDQSTNVGSNADYTWNFGDGTTSNDPNPVHNYPWGTSTTGNYTATLIIENTCDASSASLSFTVDPLGVSSIENQIGYTVFPNPTSNVWNVKFDNANKASIEVIDLAGRVIMTTNNLSGNIVTVDASNLPSGNYILKVMSNDKTAYSRVSLNK